MRSQVPTYAKRSSYGLKTRLFVHINIGLNRRDESLQDLTMFRICVLHGLGNKILRQQDSRYRICYCQVSNIQPFFPGKISEANTSNSRTILLSDERSFSVEIWSRYLSLHSGNILQ